FVKPHTLEQIETMTRMRLTIRQGYERLKSDIATFNEDEIHLTWEPSSWGIMGALDKQFEPFESLWTIGSAFMGGLPTWLEGPFIQLDAEEIRTNIEAWTSQLVKLGRSFSKKMSTAKRFKDTMRCRRGCGCGCCCTWCGVILLVLAAVFLLVKCVSGLAGWIAYIQLPVGVSVIGTNYAVTADQSGGKLPDPSVGSNMIFEIRWRGDTPADHSRLFQVSIQHEDEETEVIRYFDPSRHLLWRPDRAGTYTMTIDTHHRLSYNPITEEKWAPYYVSYDPESISETFTVADIVSQERTSAKLAVPHISPLDFMTLGCRYSLPPLDLAELGAMYEALYGEYTEDLCVRVSYRTVPESGVEPDQWHDTTCIPLTEDATYVIVVGMREEREYQMRHEFVRMHRPQPQDADFEFTLSSQSLYIEPDTDAGSISLSGPNMVTYTTAKTPKALLKSLPEISLRTQHIENHNVPTSEAEGVIWFNSLLNGFMTPCAPFATDLNGNLIYYIPYYKGAFNYSSGANGMGVRPSGQGTWFLNATGEQDMN
ncbi:hypothetical protein KIPB_007761, partial [Kipferlia bialata]